MSVFDTLKERGYLAQVTHEEELKQALENGQVTFYMGFDPTADSLHVGHFLALMAMSHMQKAGHRPICLVGGGTGTVGDPSGRTDMRKMLTDEDIEYNCNCFKKQMERFIDFSDGKALMINNGEWLRKLNYIELLPGVERAGAAVASLDLVADHEDIPLGAELLYALHEVILKRQHAALALDELEHYGGDALVALDKSAQRGAVVGLRVDKAGRQGLKELVILVLAGGGEGGYGAAVEAVFERHKLIAPVRAVFIRGVCARALSGALVGLRAGVGEEDLLHAGAGAKLLGEQGARLGEVEV